MLAKMGPFLGQTSVLLVEDHRSDQVGRKQIRCELDALESSIDGRGYGFDGQSFRKARDALQQDVAACEQSDQEALDHVFLTDNYPVDLANQLLDETAFIFNFLVDFVDVRRNFHGLLFS